MAECILFITRLERHSGKTPGHKGECVCVCVCEDNDQHTPPKCKYTDAETSKAEINKSEAGQYLLCSVRFVLLLSSLLKILRYTAQLCYVLSH